MWLVTGGMVCAESGAAVTQVADKPAIFPDFYILKFDDFSKFGLPCCSATVLRGASALSVGYILGMATFTGAKVSVKCIS